MDISCVCVSLCMNMYTHTYMYIYIHIIHMCNMYILYAYNSYN